MKLISLNTWGGRLLNPLLQFIESKSADTDIFCFQEIFMGDKAETDSHGVRLNLLNEISHVLKNFQPIFHQAPKGSLYFLDSKLPVPYGVAAFIKKPIQTEKIGGFPTWEKSLIPEEEIEPSNGNFLHFDIKTPPENITLGNLHGFLTFKSGKGNNPTTFYQAQKVSDFFESCRESTKHILVGDFNLHPQAESIKIFEKSLRNLIKEYNIPTTRNSNYKDMERYEDYIADYCFVSSDVKVESFKVLPDIVSDHQPLYLEFY
ncbi:MAG: endonuclease/exonuclease/phosphatase family protein [Patescibacteria group bacterium]